jgi:putative transposase
LRLSSRRRPTLQNTVNRGVPEKAIRSGEREVAANPTGRTRFRRLSQEPESPILRFGYFRRTPVRRYDEAGVRRPPPYPPSMPEPFIPPRSPMHHLPRLEPEFYQGFSAVFWTITLERRATGWLTDGFHSVWRELLLHAAAREGLACPTYVLMPDHLHLVWLGLRQSSDQLKAMRFLRTHLARELAARGKPGRFELQKQSHDRVLREEERAQGAMSKACFYVLDNPRRAGLVEHPKDWPHLGAMVLGYPNLHPLEEEFWPEFWKLYWRLREELPDQQKPPDPTS